MGSVRPSTTKCNNGKNYRSSHPHQTHLVIAIASSLSSSHCKLADWGYQPGFLGEETLDPLLTRSAGDQACTHH